MNFKQSQNMFGHSGVVEKINVDAMDCATLLVAREELAAAAEDDGVAADSMTCCGVNHHHFKAQQHIVVHYDHTIAAFALPCTRSQAINKIHHR